MKNFTNKKSLWNSSALKLKYLKVLKYIEHNDRPDCIYDQIKVVFNSFWPKYDVSLWDSTTDNNAW